MTRLDRDRDEQVKAYVNALKALEERGLIKSVGSDKKGVQHFLIFGTAYPKGDNVEAEKEQVISQMKILFLYTIDT
jgi:hypothetical protein